MSTGFEFALVEPRKLLGYEDFGPRLMDYFFNSIGERTELTFDTQGVFGSLLGLAADGNDKFQVTGSSKSTDGTGAILDVDELDASLKGEIQFENTSGIDYYVGLEYITTPLGVRINPRDGVPQFDHVGEYIGVEGDPDAVVDDGDDTMTFTVDSVTESGVSNAGRVVRVFKRVLADGAVTEAIAIEDCVVVWDGSNNKIETAGNFGQDTASTTPGDYAVQLLGPTVKRNTDLRTVDGVCFLGIVTGAGAGSPPSVFDTSDQNLIVSALSDIGQITRVASNGRLKVEVKAITGETDEDQIRIKNPSGVITFAVDEDGDVNTIGSLEVDLIPSGSRDLGSAGNRWSAGYFTDINIAGTFTFAGDFDPAADNTYDLGDPLLRWKQIHGVETQGWQAVIGGLYPSRQTTGYAQVIAHGNTLSSMGLSLESAGITGVGTTYRWDNDNKVLKLFATDQNNANPNQLLQLSEFGLYAYENFLPAGTATLGASGTRWPYLYADAADINDDLHVGDWLYLDGSYLDFDGIRFAHDGPISNNNYQMRAINTTMVLELATDALAASDKVFEVTRSGDTLSELRFAPAGNGLVVVGTPMKVGGDINPDTDASYGFGTAALRWYGVNAQQLFLSGEVATDTPLLVWSETDASLDQKHWFMQADSDGLHTFGVIDDTYSTPVSLWTIQRLGPGTPLAVDFKFHTHFLPDLDSTRDLGESSTPLRWRTLYVDDIDMANIAGLGFAQSIRPKNNDSIDIGSSSYKWRAFYLSDAAGSGVGTNLVPTSNATRTLGNADYRWKELHVASGAGEGVGGTLVPTSNENYNLGSASYKWSNLYADYVRGDHLVVGTLAGEGVASHLVPAADATYDYGNSAYKVRRIYLATGLNNGFATDLEPLEDSVHSLGTSGYRWLAGYFDEVFPGTFGETILPDSDFGRNIGATGTRWQHAFMNTLTLYNQGTGEPIVTLDNSNTVKAILRVTETLSCLAVRIDDGTAADIMSFYKTYIECNQPIVPAAAADTLGNTGNHWVDAYIDEIHGDANSKVSIDDVLHLNARTTDPSSLADGDIWFRSDQNQIRCRINTTTYSFDVTAV